MPHIPRELHLLFFWTGPAIGTGTLSVRVNAMDRARPRGGQVDGLCLFILTTPDPVDPEVDFLDPPLAVVVYLCRRGCCPGTEDHIVGVF